MSKSPDCLIIGAGIVGLAAARRLAMAGRQVLVLEPGTPGAEASSAAAGLLAPQIEAAARDPLLPLALRGRDVYPALVDELRDAGHRVELNREGIALLALDDARAAELAALADAPAPGVKVEWLNRAALELRQPHIGPEARGALLAHGDGCVDNVALCAALATDALRRGVRFETAAARELVTHHGHAVGVSTSAGERRAPVVVIAAGAWSAGLAGLPRPLPVRPVRGQMVAVAWPAGVPRTILFGRGAYVVPRGGEALLGSTMEDVGFDTSTTPEGVARIRHETERLLPALAGATPLRTWAGLRPMTPDTHPVLGFDPEVQGLLYATGHGRNGILLGPLTGDIIADLVVRGETREDIAPYAVQRFAKGR